MNNNIKIQLKQFINNSNNQNYDSEYFLFIKLQKLCDKIQNIILNSRLKIDSIVENNNNEIIKEEFNILFNICKKIYEAREEYLLQKIQNPITTSNSILKIKKNPFRNRNYILKFIRNLDDKEYEFIKDLLNDGPNEGMYKSLFIAVYDIFKHTDSDKLYEALSKNKISDDSITFLSPNIKKIKYIKIPDDNDSNIKKKFFIELLINFNMNPIELDTNKINFLKKILSNNYWDKLVAKYKPNEEIVYDEEIMLAYCLGFFCKYNFNYFIKTISIKIIEEKKQNITITSEKVKNAKDIVDLFEIYYVININNILINKIKKQEIKRKEIEKQEIERKELEKQKIERNTQYINLELGKTLNNKNLINELPQKSSSTQPNIHPPPLTGYYRSSKELLGDNIKDIYSISNFLIQKLNIENKINNNNKISVIKPAINEIIKKIIFVNTSPNIKNDNYTNFKNDIQNINKNIIYINKLFTVKNIRSNNNKYIHDPIPIINIRN